MRICEEIAQLIKRGSGAGASVKMLEHIQREHDTSQTGFGGFSTVPPLPCAPRKVWVEINYVSNIVTLKAAGDGIEMSFAKRYGPTVGGERFFTKGEVRTFCRLAGVDEPGKHVEGNGAQP